MDTIWWVRGGDFEGHPGEAKQKQEQRNTNTWKALPPEYHLQTHPSSSLWETPLCVCDKMRELHILDCDVPTSISLTWQPITISDTSRHNWEFPRYFFDIDNTITLTDGLITGSLCPFLLYISLTSHFEFRIEFHLSVSMLTTYHIWPWQCHFLVHCGSKSPGFCGQVEGLLGGCLQIWTCHSHFRSGQATC